MSGICRAQAFTLGLPRAGENLVIRIRVTRSSVVNGAVLSGEVVLAAVSRTGENGMLLVEINHGGSTKEGDIIPGMVETLLS